MDALARCSASSQTSIAALLCKKEHYSIEPSLTLLTSFCLSRSFVSSATAACAARSDPARSTKLRLAVNTGADEELGLHGEVHCRSSSLESALVSDPAKELNPGTEHFDADVLEHAAACYTFTSKKTLRDVVPQKP